MIVYQHRVRYNEVDEQGIVFNSHYLTWCDHAISEYFRLNDWSPIVLKQLGVDLVVRKAEIDYMASAFLDDIVEFHFDVTRIGNSSFDGFFTIKVENQLLVTVNILYVNVINGMAKGIPKHIKLYLEKSWQTL